MIYDDDLTWMSNSDDAFFRITAYARDGLISRSIADMTHPADAHARRQSRVQHIRRSPAQL